MSYRENILWKDGFQYHGYQQQIKLSKHFCESDPMDRYYLKTDIITSDNQPIHQGYLYFHIDFDTSQSEFIGACVENEYRNSGIASLLISSWIQFCLDQGIDNLKTISKQRKPFLLYLLKLYNFEIENIEEYLTSPKVVHICRKNEENDKYLIFANKREEEMFRRSNIMKTDNYKIIDATEKNIQILDSVALYNPYFLQDKEKAYQKSLQVYNRHR